MLSPALLRICCLAVMAPALTKAVKQADGLGVGSDAAFNLLPEFPHRIANGYALAPLKGVAQKIPADKNGFGAVVPTDTAWHIQHNVYNKQPVDCLQPAVNDLQNKNISPTDTTKVNSNGDCSSAVGVSSPTLDHSDYKSRPIMNDDIAPTEERMGLLNANTSLDCDIKTRLDPCQLSLDVDYKSSEFVTDIPVSRANSIPSSPGSPKSISGDSASTITAPNPAAVTFAELEEARSSYQKICYQAKKLKNKVRKLQISQVDSHVTNQIKALVSYYQKLLSVPCQRQVRNNTHRRGRDSADLKAEFFQSENVRNLSTAALVNLVRKLNSPNSEKLQSPRNSLHLVESSINEKYTGKLSLSECEEIKRVSDTFLTEVNHLESAVDSDVTESSSGGESCDEFENYDESKKQEIIPIRKRAKWKWVVDRAAVASRWTWLYSQVSDLEYRLRQVAEKHKKVQTEKGPVCFEEITYENTLTKNLDCSNILQNDAENHLTIKKSIKPVNGYLEHTSVMTNNGYHSVHNVPSVQDQCTDIHPQKNMQVSLSESSTPNSASRTRPVKTELFRKRKLVRTTGLHLISRKAAKLATVKCNCSYQSDVTPCILCGGRYNNVQSVDPDTMPLLERIALLEPSFHPVLSFEQDIPLALYFENHMKKSEAYYRVTQVSSPVPKKPRIGVRQNLDHARQRSRKLKRFAAHTLLTSARYRSNKHAVRGSVSKHMHNRKVMLKKWRGLHKSSLNSRERARNLSAASSCSSRQESPVRSPASLFEEANDASVKEHEWRRRRDDHHFDIDDVVMPYNMKKVTSVKKLPYKEIIIPNWRVVDEETEADKNASLALEENEVEDISDETFARRHERLLEEERTRVKGGELAVPSILSSRRGRRNHRYDSHADSSGANTPDPVPIYQQDIMFQDNGSLFTGSPCPCSPMSPPATPSSVAVMSDDSQPLGTALPAVRPERRRTISVTKRDRPSEDTCRLPVPEHIYVPPFEVRNFPLSDKEVEDMIKDSPHLNPLPELDEMYKDPGSPAFSSSSTSSALEDDDDITDPEWTVVRRQNGPDQTLVLKLAKR